MYHPVLGTFLSRDPLPSDGEPVLMGAIADSLIPASDAAELGESHNLYAYARSNPSNTRNANLSRSSLSLIEIAVASPLGVNTLGITEWLLPGDNIFESSLSEQSWDSLITDVGPIALAQDPGPIKPDDPLGMAPRPKPPGTIEAEKLIGPPRPFRPRPRRRPRPGRPYGPLSPYPPGSPSGPNTPTDGVPQLPWWAQPPKCRDGSDPLPPILS